MRMNAAKNTPIADETAKTLKKLHRLAKKGDLEVEDLLKPRKHSGTRAIKTHPSGQPQ